MKLPGMALTFLSLGAIISAQPPTVWGQESVRDPFSLPAGIRPPAKGNEALGSKESPSTTEVPMVTPKLKAILISDHLRLALIDHKILTVGDSINNEKVLEIMTNHVVLSRGDQQRIIHLSEGSSGLIIEKNRERR